ncbi:transposase [Clostridium oryzae]|uniref:Transposase DDE domain protein n=1 Tax=Clostridium oryzae TaxID=1450648 RepID=A0A1V4IUN7_9CLOT|nr:transposase [Clostridium oryzae]OPJ63742.1 transposase DDE domain protein [Clostridium oryzae]
MVDRSKINTSALIIADRGYEAYNNMAHIQERGWKYLIRIKDHKTYSSGILQGLELPSTEEFDVDINLKLTRKQTNEVKELLKDKNHYRLISHGKAFDYLPEKSKKSDHIKAAVQIFCIAVFVFISYNNVSNIGKQLQLLTYT